MSFQEQIQNVAVRVGQAITQAQTEEATKTSVIMPLIQALGFDVFDLNQVVPEYTADVGIKKGEKVDFALMIDGQVVFLIEAKPISNNLGKLQHSQLYRYFGVTSARIAILTNGKEVWFYTDMEERNRMDSRPFFKFDFTNYTAEDVEELGRMRRQDFDLESVLDAASSMKMVGVISKYLRSQLDNPDEDFVRFIGRQVHEGTLTKGIVEQLTPAVEQAFGAVVRDYIQERLDISLPVRVRSEEGDVGSEEINTQEKARDDGVVTTDEEVDAYLIVKAICAKQTDVTRIVMRDTKSYCGILFDDNNRHPICRLHFNSKTTKYIEIFDVNKVGTKHRIETLSDIYGLSEPIEVVVQHYQG
ncbi:type I restriction endonuclease [Cochlodiniinecator piscidefendens]|uniref:type I restriction endonuclease n=1 Tax=Cochlodiniinecator piscidefendens TaxID=2715756 RepID=UPI00140DBEB5|nr:type I restriction endonuclease [Cochlodiniinecator piscidefendens]